MSNYLKRLVNRSVNPIDTVQPRLPVRFEPRLDGFGQGVAPIQETVEPSIPDQKVGIIQPIPPTTRPTTVTLATHADIQRPSRDRSVAPIIPTVTNARFSSTLPTNAQFTEAIQPNLPVREEATPDLSTPTQGMSLSSIPDSQIAEAVLVTETIVEIDQSIAPTSDQTRIVTELPQPSSYSIQPKIVPLVQVESTAISPDLNPPPPTIQVKIGRVEVRAIPSPPSVRPATRSSTPPKLSLAAYLKARQGSER